MTALEDIYHRTGHEAAGPLLQEALDSHMQQNFYVAGDNQRRADFTAAQQPNGSWRVYPTGSSGETFVTVDVRASADNPDAATIRASQHVPSSFKIDGAVDPMYERDVRRASDGISAALRPFGNVTHTDMVVRGRKEMNLSGDALESVTDMVVDARGFDAGVRAAIQDAGRAAGAEEVGDALASRVAPVELDVDRPISGAERAELSEMLRQPLHSAADKSDELAELASQSSGKAGEIDPAFREMLQQPIGSSGRLSGKRSTEISAGMWERATGEVPEGARTRAEIEATSRATESDLERMLQQPANFSGSGRITDGEIPASMWEAAGVEVPEKTPSATPDTPNDLARLGQAADDAGEEAVDAVKATSNNIVNGKAVRNAVGEVAGKAARAVPFVGSGLAAVDTASAAEQGNYVEAGLTVAGEFVPVVDIAMTGASVIELGAAATNYLFHEPPTEAQLEAVREQGFFNAIYDNLPGEVTEGMSEEMVALVEAKQGIQAAESLPTTTAAMVGQGALANGVLSATSDRNAAIETAENEYMRLYDRLWEEGAFGNKPTAVQPPQQQQQPDDPNAALAAALANSGATRNDFQCGATVCENYQSDEPPAAQLASQAQERQHEEAARGA